MSDVKKVVPTSSSVNEQIGPTDEIDLRKHEPAISSAPRTEPVQPKDAMVGKTEELSFAPEPPEIEEISEGPIDEPVKPQDTPKPEPTHPVQAPETETPVQPSKLEEAEPKKPSLLQRIFGRNNKKEPKNETVEAVEKGPEALEKVVETPIDPNEKE